MFSSVAIVLVGFIAANLALAGIYAVQRTVQVRTTK